MVSDRQTIELFHLHFVRLLCSGPQKGSFAIKGGCNLRFFFESVRYSEDIDLDVAGIPVHALKERVTGILMGPALALPLRARGVSITSTSAPKQTDTTQRWKIGLAVEGQATPLHTKVEFSRRATTDEAEIEPVATAILAEHQLMPILAPHYPTIPALRQKVGALVGRTIVQARDVFDLAVLFARSGGDIEALRPLRTQIARAVERVMEVSYADFKSQVLSYLRPEQAAAYGSPEAWDALQMQVIGHLEKALP